MLVCLRVPCSASSIAFLKYEQLRANNTRCPMPIWCLDLYKNNSTDSSCWTRYCPSAPLFLEVDFFIRQFCILSTASDCILLPCSFKAGKKHRDITSRIFLNCDSVTHISCEAQNQPDIWEHKNPSKLHACTKTGGESWSEFLPWEMLEEHKQ